MLWILASFSHCLNPVILVPGFLRTRLAATVTSATDDGCPYPLVNESIWIEPKYLLPPKLKCTLSWLTPIFDQTTQLPVGKPNITITPIDFGGVSGIRGTGSPIFGHSLPPYFDKLIGLLESDGYKRGESLFGAPYDWRFGLAQSDIFWEDLRLLCERAVNLTNEKVLFVTHSLGGYMAHHFLTEQTDPEWRKQFIHGAVLCAPSWSGSGEAAIALWRQRSPYLKFFKSKEIRDFVMSLGGFHVHFPNSEIYGDTPVFITPDGNITARDVSEFLAARGKFTDLQQKLAECNFRFTRKAPTALDVKVRVLYNSAIDTSFGLRIPDWESEGKILNIKGDGIVGSAGIEWACENWKKEGTDIECVDVNSTQYKFHHPFLILRDDPLKVLMNWINPHKDPVPHEDL
jgi:pimeloyl-ACP methyl ester carboxylesterase